MQQTPAATIHSYFLLQKIVDHNDNFTSNFDLNMKLLFASRSSTDCFALFSTPIMELYKGS